MIVAQIQTTETMENEDINVILKYMLTYYFFSENFIF